MKNAIKAPSYARWFVNLSIFLVCTLIAATGLATGDVSTAGPDDANPVVLSLVADVETASFEQPFTLTAVFLIAPGWHIYAPWPGNTGEPTRVRFSSSDPHTAFSNVEFEYPSTWDRDELELTSFGYEKTLFVRTNARIAGIPETGTAEFKVDATWLACKNRCVSGHDTAELVVRVGDTPVSATLQPAGRMPDTLGPRDAWLKSVDYDDGVWKLDFSVNGFDSVEDFVPQWIHGGVCLIDSWQTTSGDGAGRWTMKVTLKGENCLPFAGGFIKGVPAGGNETRTFRFSAFTSPSVNPWRAGSPSETGHAGSSISVPAADISPQTGKGPEPTAPLFSWYFLLLAFAGGLLLNVMPCVIPVIVPKLNHLVRTAVTCREKRERHRLLLLNALAYCAGIFVTMTGLAAVVVILRQAGHQVGWGFQFQNPLFLAIMAAVLMLMSLGMLGVFPLQMINHTESLRSLRARRRKSLIVESFMTGLLVTFLGTPCTAPLLGPAAGFAFIAGPAQIFAFFLVLAAGFSLPFLLLALFPGWSEHLKNFRVSEKGNKWSHGLAFFLLATMVWLLGVLGESFGLDSTVKVLWFLLVLSALAWFYGVRCENFEEPGTARLEKAEQDISASLEMDARTKSEAKERLRNEWHSQIRRRRLISAGLLLVILAATGMALLRFDAEASNGQSGELSSDSPVKWKKWSVAAVEDSIRRGHPVFLDVTASWCMNCKTNEKLILNRVETADLFREYGVDAFIADFSRHDPGTAVLISSMGRAGVPVYVVYPPCGGEPVVLPEILTPDIVQDALKAAGPARNCSTTQTKDR